MQIYALSSILEIYIGRKHYDDRENGTSTCEDRRKRKKRYSIHVPHLCKVLSFDHQSQDSQNEVSLKFNTFIRGLILQGKVDHGQ